MHILRMMSKYIAKVEKFPIIAILGPRQSGKTTFAKNYFTQHQFISFEQESVRQEAEQDPAKFFKKYDNPFGLVADKKSAKK